MWFSWVNRVKHYADIVLKKVAFIEGFIVCIELGLITWAVKDRVSTVYNLIVVIILLKFRWKIIGTLLNNSGTDVQTRSDHRVVGEERQRN